MDNMILNIVVAVLAVHQIVNIIRYSALFAWLRDRIETGQKVLSFLPQRASDFLAELISCPWCLSVHISWIVLLGFVLPDTWIFPVVLRFAWYTLALSQAANFLHLGTGHSGYK